MDPIDDPSAALPDRDGDTDDLSRSRFRFWLLSLLGAYVLVEVVYVLRLPLVMDEFAGAREIYRLVDQIPYRDFMPYKTLLGYLVQAPVLILTPDTWWSMIAVKLQMVAINASAAFFACSRLANVFSRRAVVAALALLLVMSNFLERSAELRVDMLTGWAGLFSLVFLLEGRFLRAGLWGGLSFLVSQKGIYFLLGGAFALAVELVITRTREDLRKGVLFASGATVIIAAYLVLFGAIGGVNNVIAGIFENSSRVAQQSIPTIWPTAWQQTLSRNPLFYLLALAGPLLLVRRFRSRSQHERLLVFFALGFCALAVWHKQPWPYYFVIPAVAFFVQIVAAVDSSLPLVRKRGTPATVLVTAYFLLGIVYPLSRLDDNLSRSSSFQHAMVTLGEAMLERDETYFAGFDLLYRHEHHPAELRWLDSLHLARLNGMREEQLQEIVNDLTAHPPKFVLMNYRIPALPRPIAATLQDRYAHLWGAIYTYAPLVSPGISRIDYSGRYLTRGRPGSSLIINGRRVQAGEVLELPRGAVSFSEIEDPGTRLLLTPEGIEPYLDEATRRSRPFFVNVYSY